ncbi:MAG: TldD/PmbA family protein [Gemmatimonadetes bacterium]|nr:TldD/PmbA family protein [Gemmatimonadota bacterium]
MALSTAEGCQVSVNSGIDGNTRFAANEVSTSGDASNASVTVTSRFGKRAASATTNVFDDAGLKRAVETSERLARLAPENPELMPLLPPQRYRDVRSLFDSSLRLDAAARADAVKVATEACERAGAGGAGFIQRTAGAGAVANSAGLFAYQPASSAAYTLTVRTPDGRGSGWAGTAHNDWARITPPATLAERAIKKALDSREPVTIEPGKYTVVLEPTAVGNLLRVLEFAMGARAADEGRSFFSRPGGGTKLGEKIVDERVTILSDPQDPDLLSRPYTGDGFPVERTVWIENGVVKNLAYDRFWAEKKGVRPTPFAGGLKMLGGTATLDELIAGVRRGLLVTRFWYIRGVDPRSILNTGLTRDGLFLIENGRITRAVKNFRFNESPVIMLNNLEALGRPERVSASESGGVESGGAVVVPPLVARDFTFSSISEAV